MKLVDKQFLTYLIEIPVTQVEPGIVDDDIRQIHIESEEFKPATLFSKYHPDLSGKELQSYHKAIPSQMGRIADHLLC